MDRLEMLRRFAEQKPDEPFARYGLAMELKKRGRLAEAIAVYRDLIARNPAYVPTYLMASNALVEHGDRPGAIEVLTQGIAAARAAGDHHARGELESALAALEG